MISDKYEEIKKSTYEKSYTHFGVVYFFQTITAQIAITEVYYNTPANESQKYPNAYMGEFVELYNYTTTDIPLDGWYLSDNRKAYYFPQGVVIKSGDFLIVAYRDFVNMGEYFTKIFPNTQGQESKILYQFKMVLNNFGDQVRLFTSGNILAKDISIPATVMIDVDKAVWSDQEYMHLSLNERRKYVRNKSNYDSKTSEGDGSGANYYVNSLQKSAENTYNENNKANPLTALYKPPMIDYNDVPAVKNIYQNNYALLTWAYYVNQILNNTCNYDIPTVEQSNSPYVLTAAEQCFKHDSAGNMDVKDGCATTNTAFSTTGAVTSLQDDPEQIKNRIQIYPNPTSSTVTITWDNEVDQLISQMRIVALNGAYNVSVPKSTANYTFTVDLSIQPAGIYVLMVNLTTGGSVSKNIMKL